MAEAYIVGAVRTPIGKRNGGLAKLNPVDLAAHVLRELVVRTGIDAAAVEDVIMGCVSQIGPQSLDIARQAWLSAGLPESVPGVTVDRQCGSSQQALHFAAQAVLSGTQDLVVAAGVESMSVVPMGSSIMLPLEKGMPLPFGTTPVGDVAVDEGPRRDTTLEKMAGLEPLREGWEVTAAAASQISDGSAALLVASETAVQRYGLTPRARIVALAVAGADPVFMLTGPIPATEQVLARAGLKVDDIDVFEVNEAFAPVLIAWSADTGASLEKTNPNGGAIALGHPLGVGHPLGATGAVLATKLLHELERSGGRYGLQTMCEGGGQANATVIERL